MTDKRRHMSRFDIISKIGREFLTSNIENDEFRYPKAFKEVYREFHPVVDDYGRNFENLDIRFVKDDVSVLVETKVDFYRNLEKAKEQLAAYVKYEKELTGNKVIAILANTGDDSVLVFKEEVSDSGLMNGQGLMSVEEFYLLFHKPVTSIVQNRKEMVQKALDLDNLLARCGVRENIRSQFVAICLMALNEGKVEYNGSKFATRNIVRSLKDYLDDLLEERCNDFQNRQVKINAIKRMIFDCQDIREMDTANMKDILMFLENEILPAVRGNLDQPSLCNDITGFMFTSLSKFALRADKNQVLTPDHIADLLCDMVDINESTRVLDPCCGSGAFLVKAMLREFECARGDKSVLDRIKQENIHGFEFDETMFVLVTTNMLIHSDGNSNIWMGSCFDKVDEIKKIKPDVVFMNPPYNASSKYMPKEYTQTWKKTQKEDPSKGLYFVNYIIDVLSEIDDKVRPSKVVVILPLQCAIGSSSEIKKYKRKIMEKATLDAAFTMPPEMFYPSAGVNTCCMIFDVGRPHSDVRNVDTFFGYFTEDGFERRRNLGRVDKVTAEGESSWEKLKAKYLDLYRRRVSEPGLSVTHKVSPDDEWLCEAYMETDYSKLNAKDFQKVLNEFIAYQLTKGVI